MNGKVCSLAKAFHHRMQWIMRRWDLHAILSYINCNSRQTRIFSLQIASWISNGVSLLAQISKPLDALRARLLLTSSCYEGLQDYACASKDCAVGLWGLVPYFDLRICHIRLVYWRVFDLLAPPYMPFGGWNRPRLASASLKLLSGSKRDEKINGRDFPRDDVLGTQVSRKIAKNLL